MSELIESLRARAHVTGMDLPEEVFHLLAAACSECCQECCSGNGSCPPPKVEAEISVS